MLDLSATHRGVLIPARQPSTPHGPSPSASARDSLDARQRRPQPPLTPHATPRNVANAILRPQQPLRRRHTAWHRCAVQRPQTPPDIVDHRLRPKQHIALLRQVNARGLVRNVRRRPHILEPRAHAQTREQCMNRVHQARRIRSRRVALDNSCNSRRVVTPVHDVHACQPVTQRQKRHHRTGNR